MRLEKCELCKNCYDNDFQGTYRCSAFPNGVPEDTDFWDYRAECANGIKFESKEGRPSKSGGGIMKKSGWHRIG